MSNILLPYVVQIGNNAAGTCSELDPTSSYPTPPRTPPHTPPHAPPHPTPHPTPLPIPHPTPPHPTPPNPNPNPSPTQAYGIIRSVLQSQENPRKVTRRPKLSHLLSCDEFLDILKLNPRIRRNTRFCRCPSSSKATGIWVPRAGCP